MEGVSNGAVSGLADGRIPPVTPPLAVKYAKSGDIFVAYQITGAGPHDLVWAPGATSHLNLQWENPYAVRMIERLSSFSRLIRFDKRGTGLSDAVRDVPTLEQRIDDIRAVMDAAGSERAHIFGISEGGPMACLFAATYPGRTRSLALYGTKARWSKAADYPWAPDRDERERELRRQEAEGPPPFELNDRLKRWLGPLHADPAFVDWFVRWRSAGASPSMVVAMHRMNLMIDIRDILPAIRVPVLVMVRPDDPVAPLEAVVQMVAAIPSARMFVLPGHGHMYLDVADEMCGEIERFITGAQAPAVTDRVLATLVFADVVGSTERAVALGDRAWRDLLERYYALVRRELAVHSGVEVDTAGDGLLARFDGPGRAIRCARAIQRVGGEVGIDVRAGVHTGEVELAGSAVRGIAVHVAARIASLAGAGDVYVSNTVRDLVAGSGLTFADRGLHTLKGVPEPRQVLAVA
jgi:class 3 adenylate cyclase/pimeloyl-ACP methyl ester carboxylesterase